MQIESDEDFYRAFSEIQSLIHAGSVEEAIQLAESHEGEEFLCLQLRGWAYSEGGIARGSREDLLKGVAVWESLQSEKLIPNFAFNQANSEQGVFDAVARADGYAVAIEKERERLHRARDLFTAIAADEESEDSLRVQASTNLGNTLDNLGRDVEAFDSYDDALALDPDFGMAAANKGIGLANIAGLIPGHEARIFIEARLALEHGIADEDRVVQIGGPRALENFRETLERVRSLVGESAAPAPSGRWSDPYRQWVREQGLFLHVSQDCLSDEELDLDPLFFTKVHTDLSDGDQTRLNQLVDAFNVVKQDYLAVRYLTWLVTSADSPIREHAAVLSAQARFWNSLTYATWGVRRGLTTMAFSSAVDVLDKVASLVHLYLDTGRVRDVYFSSLSRKRGKNKPMDDAIKNELESGNRGLLALVDLSGELERDTPLNELVAHRHAATHRFLVVHEMLIEDEDASAGEWLDRVERHDLVEGLLAQLRIGRAAIVYLARTIEIREHRVGQEHGDGETPIPTLPAIEGFTESAEFD